MPDFPHKADTKVGLRASVLAARRTRSATALTQAAVAVRQTIAELVRRTVPASHAGDTPARGWTMAAYVPVGTEPGGPDLQATLAGLLPAGGRLLLPVLRLDLDLDWAAWTAEEPLVAAGRGLREPPGPRLGRRAIAGASLVIVPALAVDRRGRRLGRGGGSYDRALARIGPAALTVALLHDDELVTSVPAETHDQRVRAVITPTAGLIRLDEGASDSALLALG